ncbi:flagellar hook-basal body complex protein FliE [Pelagibius sp. Alg239-R121]|uniref:flagellar hook-basal body complex protein FliE n=1 Tax=Pelagibius sp. Alg239-R121 TaxID=2993448 RepID=UPI0024A6EF70|nr:flagellar hook-basal body complex protein FliE [Pelagibius sp. Alg239-R121]
MPVNFSDAVSAYQKVAGKDTVKPSGSNPIAPSEDFASTLRGMADEVVGTLNEGEMQSLKAAAGTADLTEVVTAMSKAEVTLQTVVTVRDRVVQAYQEILRMPI